MTAGCRHLEKTQRRHGTKSREHFRKLLKRTDWPTIDEHDATKPLLAGCDAERQTARRMAQGSSSALNMLEDAREKQREHRVRLLHAHGKALAERIGSFSIHYLPLAEFSDRALAMSRFVTKVKASSASQPSSIPCPDIDSPFSLAGELQGFIAGWGAHQIA